MRHYGHFPGWPGQFAGIQFYGSDSDEPGGAGGSVSGPIRFSDSFQVWLVPKSQRKTGKRCRFIFVATLAVEPIGERNML